MIKCERKATEGLCGESWLTRFQCQLRQWTLQETRLQFLTVLQFSLRKRTSFSIYWVLEHIASSLTEKGFPWHGYSCHSCCLVRSMLQTQLWHSVQRNNLKMSKRKRYLKAYSVNTKLTKLFCPRKIINRKLFSSFF